MRLKFSVAMAALALSVPAQAVQPPPPPPTVVDACSAAFVNGAVACQGYYGTNYINGAVGFRLMPPCRDSSISCSTALLRP